MSGKPLYFPWGNTTNDHFGETPQTTTFGETPQTTSFYKISLYTEARQWFWYHSRMAGSIRPNKMLLFWGFPKGNKGVFRTTGDPGRNFFWGLWIPYGYPKNSDPLQNRRLLPLRAVSRSDLHISATCIHIWDKGGRERSSRCLTYVKSILSPS